MDDSAASLTNKSGRGRRMRDGGKWEKTEETERDKVALTALSCLHLERVKCNPVSEWVCVGVNVCAHKWCVCVRFTE